VLFIKHGWKILRKWRFSNHRTKWEMFHL
jgi:hypothetical protein